MAMIVKNEQEMLARCLESVKEADDIYILDTGSIDNTIEIAKRYTTHVFDDYKWNDNYAEARNKVLDKIREDYKNSDEVVYITSIDADEFCHDFSKVREAVEEADKKGALAVDVKLISEQDKQAHFYPRLFKMSDKVWWEGAWHNHISEKAMFTSKVEITYGYSPAHIIDKDRALRIAGKEIAKPDHSPRTEFYYGREFWYRQKFKECAEIMEGYLKRAFFLAEKADAYLILSKCYWTMGRGDEAREACANALIINPHFKEAVNFMAKLAGQGTGHPLYEKNAEWWRKASENSDNTNVLFVRNDFK